MSNKTDEIKLAPSMDIIAAEKFKEQLLAAINDAGKVTINASDVDRITTPCIQLFLSADKELANNGGALKMINASDITISALKDIGLEKEYLRWSS